MYTEAILGNAIVPASNAFLTAASLTSVAGWASFYCLESVKVIRIMGIVTTALVADTAVPVVTFYKRITQGSDTGAVSIGTLTFPDSTAAGKVVYKNVEGTKLTIGDELYIKVTTAATSAGSVAGAAFLGFKCCDVSEDPLNAAKAILSA